MARLYAQLVIDGERTLDQIPATIKDKVIEILKENDYPVD